MVAARSSGTATGRDGSTTTAVEVALLDRSGVIVAVNDAWTAFGAENDADPERIGVGVSYLDMCATVPDDPFARAVASAIGTALAGDLPAPVQVALPCHRPDEPRWFDVLISSRFDDACACIGATVTLSLVRSRNWPPPGGRHGWTSDQGLAVPAFYPEQSERLGDVFAQFLLDRAPLAILVVDDQGTVVRAGRAAERLFGHGPDGLAGMPLRHLLPGLVPLVDPDAPGSSTRAAVPALLVDGVLADGSTTSLEILLGKLPLSRGTGVVVLAQHVGAAASEVPAGHVIYLDHEIDDVVGGLDEVVRHVFAGGLTVTGAAAARQSDRALVTTLLGVTEGLDRIVREVRSAAFRLQQFGRRLPPPPPPSSRNGAGPG